MIRIDNIVTYGWEAAIRGMRNPMNSWEKSDSDVHTDCDHHPCLDVPCIECPLNNGISDTGIGLNDLSLMLRLAKAGSDHAKYRRMITVTMDILAPLYWWKEFDTYKVGTVANSCSTMHKIMEKEFTLDDFSHEHLAEVDGEWVDVLGIDPYSFPALESMDAIKILVEMMNAYRIRFINTKDKKYWWQIIQLLPSSYNQLRTVQLNYEVLANIYLGRCDHKLDEWREFCKTIEGLPYSRVITLKDV